VAAISLVAPQQGELLKKVVVRLQS